MKRITFDIAHALESLYPEGGKFMQEGLDYSGLTWSDESRPKPSEAELNSEIIRLQEEYDSQEYARKRAQEYPDLAEQLDLLWHAIDTDTLDNKDYRNKFYTMLKKVKEDNPKG